MKGEVGVDVVYRNGRSLVNVSESSGLPICRRSGRKRRALWNRTNDLVADGGREALDLV